MALGWQPLVQTGKKTFTCRNGALQGWEDCFLSPFVQLTRKKGFPEPTKLFLTLSPDMAMLFAPFRCTQPPPLCAVFSTYAEPISKGHCWKWHHKTKVSCRLQTVSWVKVLIESSRYQRVIAQPVDVQASRHAALHQRAQPVDVQATWHAALHQRVRLSTSIQHSISRTQFERLTILQFWGPLTPTCEGCCSQEVLNEWCFTQLVQVQTVNKENEQNSREPNVMTYESTLKKTS